MLWILGIGVFLFLLFAFPKQVGVLILALVGFGVWLYLSNEQVSRAREKEQSSVLSRAAHDPATCTSATHPIAVTFTNTAGRSTTSIRFRLTAHRPGYSKPVVDESRETDKIIAPNQTFGACWSIPARYGEPLRDSPESLVWTAPISYVEFR